MGPTGPGGAPGACTGGGRAPPRARLSACAEGPLRAVSVRSIRRLTALLAVLVMGALLLPAGTASGKGSRRFTVLATGDSMIQIIDSFLKERLGPGGIRV